MIRYCSTSRVLGVMRSHLHDELLADSAALAATTGTIRADWLRMFLGLEEESGWRPGGRLELYRGTPPLSDQAFARLAQIGRQAARNLERFAHDLRGEQNCPEAQARLILSLARVDLAGLAAADGAERLRQAYA